MAYIFDTNVFIRSKNDSSATCLDSNLKAFSTFIPAPDPRAFDGGDILRQKKKQ